MNRVSLLNYLAAQRNYSSYLEIGCNRNGTFRRINIPHKIGVDPARGGTLKMTSDDFFIASQEEFDLIFIDGLHRDNQVLKDVENSLKCLSDRGCIVLHDCLPMEESQQLPEPPGKNAPWTGDVWKAIVELRTRSDLDLAVLDADWGLGVLFHRPNTRLLDSIETELTWEGFDKNRNEWMRIMNIEEIFDFVEGTFL